MTPEKVLEDSVALYEQNLENIVKIKGSQVLFIDDSPEMLKFIEIKLQRQFNLLEGFMIEPNPVFAKHVLDFFISKNVKIKEIIKCAVLDIDFGIYNRNISVNDLISLFLKEDVSVVLFSSAIDWKQCVAESYHDKVSYIYKSDPHAMNKIYDIIQEHSSYEIQE